MSVKVAVRVRPFNSREQKLGCKLVVEMEDDTTTLIAYQKQAQRKFTFDYSIWSFDGYEKEENGYLKSKNGKYVDQKMMYDKIGKKVLDNSRQGYHCCLFAYGQTGAGKSYSMIGSEDNKGIVPTVCSELFQSLKTKNQNQQFEIHVSMLQIYNEAVQDLTVEISERPISGLKIRESKLLGVYVDGIKKHYVESFEEVEKIMERGTKNRTIAATQMNATSSRAHTIITLQFKQKKMENGIKTEKISLINLVDLAGSERQGKTGAGGQRLKQAVGINLSLSTLGQVISILSENSSGGTKFVPYRSSSLTRILQNALGGNSQTIMICAISPANDNYEETLSTLRYADQAKKIKNKAVVNENSTDKMIRQLKAENQRLRKIVERANTGNVGSGIIPNLSENEENGMSSENNKKQRHDSDFNNGLNKKEVEIQNSFEADSSNEAEDIDAEMKALNLILEDQFKTTNQRKKQAQLQQNKFKQKERECHENQQIIMGEKEISEMEKSVSLPPYLQNISRDFLLNHKLKILLQKIGKKDCNPPNQIIFSGRDMQPYHASLVTDDEGNVTLSPINPQSHLYVNGQPISNPTILKHMDRIIFGWNSVYLFKDKLHKRLQNTVKSKYVDWDFVKQEVQNYVDIDQSDEEDETDCCVIF